ncbi:ABC transporter permease [Paenibacillus swuensis]|uniref:ABC transporter permease n=1 Tax=Paenibacillus swuensis TaxID=1178515 RepID=A0A172THU8_9BACL|nr:carbohydrate ABC transporter permease [Paenibacillus swuensis]ANE46590.1 ABC transporter permease [Paenibacillus swuensis]
MVVSRTAGSKIADGIILIALLLMAFLCIAPLLHVAAISLSDSAKVSAGLVSFLPLGINFDSYIKIMNDSRFYEAFGISVQRVLLGGLINFVLCVLMAYPLSREKSEFKPRNLYMWFLIFTMMFSAGLVPTYITIKSLHLMDTIWALVLPGAVPVFNLILLVNFFRNLPKELDEAAYMDGAGPLYLLFYVYIPLSLPAIATITLFSIVGHWNSFFDGLIYMNYPENFPLQTYISQVVINIDPNNITNVNDVSALAAISNRTLSAAKIFLSMLPILLIYPFLQRYFITGITLGSVKE